MYSPLEVINGIEESIEALQDLQAEGIEVIEGVNIQELVDWYESILEKEVPAFQTRAGIELWLLFQTPGYKSSSQK